MNQPKKTREKNWITKKNAFFVITKMSVLKTCSLKIVDSMKTIRETENGFTRAKQKFREVHIIAGQAKSTFDEY